MVRTIVTGAPFSVTRVEDSFAYMKDVPEKNFAHTITDPPYTEHVHANMMSGTTFKQYVNGELKQSGVPKVEAQFEPLDQREFVKDLVRVSKRWALSFCALEDFGIFATILGRKEYVRSGVWYKPNSMGQLTGDRPAVACEGIACMHRAGKKTWNGHGSYGVWKCNGTRGEKGRHPNQKPLDLCLMLVAKFTNRGEIIFDPFCGSGRIGEAALLLGRLYVGWDNSEEWVGKASERCEAAASKFGTYNDEKARNLCSMRDKKPDEDNVTEEGATVL